MAEVKRATRRGVAWREPSIKPVKLSLEPPSIFLTLPPNNEEVSMARAGPRKVRESSRAV